MLSFGLFEALNLDNYTVAQILVYVKIKFGRQNSYVIFVKNNLPNHVHAF
jgi:hypothetical protein